MNRLLNLILCGGILLLSVNVLAQSVGINDTNANPDPSAMLDVQSTNKGMLVPRMTTSQINLISNAAVGLLVFATDTESFWFKTTSGWMELNNDVTVNNTLSGNGTATNPLGLAQNGATNGQVLTWNGTTWEPKTFASVLPSGTSAGQVLTWNGTSWQADDSPSGVPVGTIIAYASASAPAGYLSCNGSAVSPFVYPKLYSAIGTTWGGTPDVFFNLPDLRGQFLRGYSGSSNNDADKDSRTAKYSGGATGNNVGSYQDDAFKSHSHNLNNAQSVLSQGPSMNLTTQGGGNFGYNTLSAQNTGGSETRPKNAYVNYIIKY